MNFTKRLKQDKKFRLLVVAIAVILVIAFNNNSKKEAPSVAICNSFNGGGGEGQGIFDKEDVEGCISNNCNFQHESNPHGIYAGAATIGSWLWGWFGLGTGYNHPVYCVVSVANGKYVFATSQSDADSQCTSGFASNTIDTDGSLTVHICREPTDDTERLQTCNSNEQAIASFVNSFLPDLRCKNAYYLALGLGAMLVFMMIGMVF